MTLQQYSFHSVYECEGSEYMISRVACFKDGNIYSISTTYL